MSHNRMTKCIIETYGGNLQKLSIMEQDKNILKRIRLIQNEISTNLLYYVHNVEHLNMKYDNANVSPTEKQIMFNAMELRKKIAERLLKKLENYIKEYDLPIKYIKTE